MWLECDSIESRKLKKILRTELFGKRWISFEQKSFLFELKFFLKNSLLNNHQNLRTEFKSPISEFPFTQSMPHTKKCKQSFATFLANGRYSAASSLLAVCPWVTLQWPPAASRLETVSIVASSELANSLTSSSPYVKADGEVTACEHDHFGKFRSLSDRNRLANQWLVINGW